jgi:hypothetical protein
VTSLLSVQRLLGWDCFVSPLMSSSTGVSIGADSTPRRNSSNYSHSRGGMVRGHSSAFRSSGRRGVRRAGYQGRPRLNNPNSERNLTNGETSSSLLVPIEQVPHLRETLSVMSPQVEIPLPRTEASELEPPEHAILDAAPDSTQAEAQEQMPPMAPLQTEENTEVVEASRVEATATPAVPEDAGLSPERLERGETVEEGGDDHAQDRVEDREEISRLDRKGLEERIYMLEKSKGRCRKEVRDQRRKIDGLVEAHARNAKRLDQERARSSQLESELKALCTRYEKSQHLLAIRGEELKVVQEFAPKPDGYSTADILTTLQALNDEIFQTAAFITHVILPGKMHFGYSEHILSEDIIHRFLDERLLTYFKCTTPRERLPDLVTCAIQAALATATKQASVCWSSYQDVNLGLTRVYDAMKDHEPQSVVSKWRMLTKTYERLSPEDEQGRLRQLFVDTVQDAFRALGYASQQQDHLQGLVEGEKLEDFNDRITALNEHSMKLRHMIGREVLSSEFSIVDSSGDDFDPETMEDDGGDDGGIVLGEGSVVLCTTELGLKTARKEGKVWQDTILQKPKVIVATMLPAGF